MRKVSEVLSRKGSAVVEVRATQNVIEALQLMAEKNIGSVVVKDENGRYRGILTERDYSRKIILLHRSSTETTVAEIMSTDLPKISLFDTVEHCMQLMTDNNVRYLPVFSGEELKGIISMTDVVKETILAQQETIDQLKQYITL
ncbi:MAG TPA: CBS domain-containing protein [Chitinophagaceae bacterium]